MGAPWFDHPAWGVVERAEAALGEPLAPLLLAQAAADRHPGRMAAVIGAEEPEVLEACDAAPDECWLANDNAPGQIVIAGTPSGIERATKAAAGLGIRRVMPLKVGGAFHTPLMQ